MRTTGIQYNNHVQPYWAYSSSGAVPLYYLFIWRDSAIVILVAGIDTSLAYISYSFRPHNGPSTKNFAKISISTSISNFGVAKSFSV